MNIVNLNESEGLIIDKIVFSILVNYSLIYQKAKQ